MTSIINLPKVSTGAPLLIDKNLICGNIHLDFNFNDEYIGERENGENDDVRIFCWLTHTITSLCEFDLQLNDGQAVAISKLQPNKNEFNIFLRDVCVAIVKANSVTPVCEDCDKVNSFPQLVCLMMARGEQDGWMLFGVSIVPLLNYIRGNTGEIEVRNLAIEISMEIDSSKEKVMLGDTKCLSLSIESPSNLVEYSMKESSYTVPLFEEFADMNFKKFINKFRMTEDEKYIFEPKVALALVIVAKQLYFVNNVSRIGATVAWYEAQIIQSLRLAGRPNDYIEKTVNGYTNDNGQQINGFDWNSTTRPKEWNEIMCIIIRGFTLFVTQYKYIPDSLKMKMGKIFPFEQFSGPFVPVTGYYDCEDGAWLLMAMLQFLQEYTGDSPLLTAVSTMLQQYIIFNAVVSAKSPKVTFKATVGGDHLFYHMTCTLLNKAVVYRNLGYVYEGTTPFIEQLNRLYVESTSNIYPDPTIEINGVRWDMLQEIVQNDYDLLNAPTENNMPGSKDAEMFVNVMYLYTEYFIKHPINGMSITTEFVVTEKNSLQVAVPMSKIETETQFHPTSDITALMNSEEYKYFFRTEPPPVVLDINLPNFLEKIRTVNPNNDSIWWNGYIERNTEHQNNGIPLFGWNLTNATEQSKVTPHSIIIQPNILTADYKTNSSVSSENKINGRYNNYRDIKGRQRGDNGIIGRVLQKAQRTT